MQFVAIEVISQDCPVRIVNSPPDRVPYTQHFTGASLNVTIEAPMGQYATVTATMRYLLASGAFSHVAEKRTVFITCPPGKKIVIADSPGDSTSCNRHILKHRTTTVHIRVSRDDRGFYRVAEEHCDMLMRR